jgi:bacterioferritin-associated ferredoxin
MYICICYNVNEKKIAELMQQGYSMEYIIEKNNIGKKCGKCIVEFKKKYLEKKGSKWTNI